MARLDRTRLEQPGGRTVAVATRYVDLDTQGHLNNAVASVVLQEARAAFTRDMGFRMDAAHRMMVVSQTIEFAAELRYPAPVQITTRLVQLGRTSFTIGQVARQGGVGALFSETVQVVADASGPIPLPSALRDVLDRATAIDSREDKA